MMQEGFETRKIFHDQSSNHSLSDLWKSWWNNRKSDYLKIMEENHQDYILLSEEFCMLFFS